MAIYHTQIEKKFFDAIEPSVKSLGFEVVRAKVFHAGREKTLQLMIERKDGNAVTITDCEAVSHHISTVLDVEDIIDHRYNLEVSSPGLNRPLTRMSDFLQNIGNIVKIVLFTSVDGKKKVTGKLLSVEGENVTFLPHNSTEPIVLNFENIEEAFLQYFDSNIKL